MDDSEEAKLNWRENMLGHHCNSPNVDGMPGVENENTGHNGTAGC